MQILLSANQPGLGSWGSLIIIAVMLVLLYFIMIRPQRKQEKETAEMRNNLQIGDEIVTIGGIVGIIISLSGEETLTIISSRDRTRIQLLRSAVARVQVPAKDNSKDAGKEQTEKADKDNK